jgi:2'-5' RNA ligase
MSYMVSDPKAAGRSKSFALVSYIPEPLAGFLDRLRQELVPNCFLRAHITILPPRPSTTTPDVAWAQLSEAAVRFRPFDIELKSIQVFPVSDVIYVSVGSGEKQLREMHAGLNIGGLQYDEPFKFHPHVTLAQELKCDELDELFEVARRRWDEFKFDHVFHVHTLTFVESANRKKWNDLAECKLSFQRDVPPIPPRDHDQRLHP